MHQCYDLSRYTVNYQHLESLIGQVKVNYSQELTNFIKMILVQDDLIRPGLQVLETIWFEEIRKKGLSLDILTHSEFKNIEG